MKSSGVRAENVDYIGVKMQGLLPASQDGSLQMTMMMMGIRFACVGGGGM